MGLAGLRVAVGVDTAQHSLALVVVVVVYDYRCMKFFLQFLMVDVMYLYSTSSGGLWKPEPLQNNWMEDDGDDDELDDNAIE